MAVDLGTANTIVYVRGRGIELAEPSVVAVETSTKEALAVGVEAKRMIGRTPSNIQAISPLEEGVIADFEVCEKMLRHFIEKVRVNRWSRPRMVICVPSRITGVEKRAVIEAAEYAGARKAFIIEEPMAAAIGAGLPVQSARGSMIVDIGGGTTEVAVISLGGIVCSASLRTAGAALDAAIVAYVHNFKQLTIGVTTAEELKIKMGSAWPMQPEIAAEISGRDLLSGLPRTVGMTSEEVREAMSTTITEIVDCIKETLDQTPPELAADVMDEGITLTGGGALMPGLDHLVEFETGIAVEVARDPLYSVVLGSGQTLESFDHLHHVLSSSGEAV